MDTRFLQPDGLVFKDWQATDGTHHRTAFSPTEGNVKGTILLLQGFSEFIEKYFEVIRDLNTAGYDIYTFDWRGQGKSHRLTHNGRAGIFHNGFEHDARYLKEFIETQVGDQHPRYALAHSMGGHLTLRALHHYPHLFDAVSLSAPMMQFKMPFPRWFARGLTTILHRLGCDHLMAGSEKNRENVYILPDIQKDKRSKDPVRRQVHYHWTDADKTLRLGGISFQWVYHALRSIALLESKDTLESITKPILIGLAENDQIVENAHIRDAAARLPHATLLPLPDAEHEIMMERDDIRDVFLTKTLAFFNENR